MKTLLLALVGTAYFCQPVSARPRLALEMQLLEGAMREQKLVLYTTMDLPQGIQVIHDFVQKYPFLDLELHPLEPEALVARVQNDYRSGGAGCDVLIGGGGLLRPLFEENVLASYHSLERGALSEGFIDSEGYWSGYYVNSYVIAYNTILVKHTDVPKSYADLLDSRWRGQRIAIDHTAHALLRGLTPAWGETKALGYLKRLAAQHPVVARGSIAAVDALHTGAVSLVIARAPVVQGYKEKLRSPVQWIFVEPIVAQIDALMLAARSRHPHAARLFVNFALSREGQGTFASVQQIPIRRDMEATKAARSRTWFVERPDQQGNVQETVRLFREIFGIR